MAYALLQIQEGFPDYLAIKYGFSLASGSKQRKPLFPLSREALRRELRQFATILRTGIGGRT